ncbi:hypothetical protein [Ruegeria lacuscaerulensis]|nr:hypothetical protein [Ruegeria lacuscaerulensis]
MTDHISSLADYPNSFWKRFKITTVVLDGFHHVNNAVHLKWMPPFGNIA